jgi:hypothetical protein
MSTIGWARRLTVAGVAGIGLVGVGAGVASAQGSSTSTTPSTQPAPITISSAQVQKLCDTRVPKLKAEVTKLINRIDGGPDVQGSTQWLHAKAQQAQAKGHTGRADILNGRAERRTGVLTILQKTQTKLNDFSSAHCGGGK